jgi:hypothetical protein
MTTTAELTAIHAREFLEKKKEKEGLVLAAKRQMY